MVPSIICILKAVGHGMCLITFLYVSKFLSDCLAGRLSAAWFLNTYRNEGLGCPIGST